VTRGPKDTIETEGRTILCKCRQSISTSIFLSETEEVRKVQNNDADFMTEKSFNLFLKREREREREQKNRNTNREKFR